MTLYIDAETIIAINLAHGGPGAGARDLEGIQAAAARPKATGFGQDLFPDVWSKAAAYLHGLSSTQYFHDGNKRTAWLVVDAFLALNGYPLPDIADVEAEALVLSVAKDLFSSHDEPDRTIEAAADWFRTRWMNRRQGAAKHPRLEFLMAAHGVLRLEDIPDTFNVVGGTIRTVMVSDVPVTFSFDVVGRYFWAPADVGMEHRVEVDAQIVSSEHPTPIIGKTHFEMKLSGPPPSAHFDQDDGVLPHIFWLGIDLDILAEAELLLNVQIDGDFVGAVPLKILRA